MAQNLTTHMRISWMKENLGIAGRALSAYERAASRGDDVTPHAQRLIRALHQIRTQSNLALIDQVREARNIHGLPWAAIGDAMEMSRQGAQIFYRRNA